MRHLLVCLLAIATAALVAGEIPLANGQKIAFLGDSITANGTKSPLGWVNEVVAGLAANGITVTSIGAGVHGDTSKGMLARLDKDVLAKKPDWMTLSCGVNDLTDKAWGVPLEDFKKNVTAILDAAAAAKVQVLILTPTPAEPDLDSPGNRKQEGYNAFLRAISAERHLRLADPGADLRAAIKAWGKGGYRYTVDGVHMNPSGNLIMARAVLRAFGLDAAQVHKAEDTWLDRPKTITDLSLPLELNLRQYQRLEAAADQAGKPVKEFLADRLRQDIAPLLATP